MDVIIGKKKPLMASKPPLVVCFMRRLFGEVAIKNRSMDQNSLDGRIGAD